jgi:hypothetical protein
MRIRWLVAGWALVSAVRRLSRRTGETDAEAYGTPPGDEVIARPHGPVAREGSDAPGPGAGRVWLVTSEESWELGQGDHFGIRNSSAFSQTGATCCQSLLLDTDATIGIDLHKRLFLLVIGRGE